MKKPGLSLWTWPHTPQAGCRLLRRGTPAFSPPWRPDVLPKVPAPRRSAFVFTATERASSETVARLASGTASDNRREWGTDDLSMQTARFASPCTALQCLVRNKWGSRRPPTPCPSLPRATGSGKLQHSKRTPDRPGPEDDPLDDVDLATYDKATVATLYDKLHDLPEDEPYFFEGQ